MLNMHKALPVLQTNPQGLGCLKNHTGEGNP